MRDFLSDVRIALRSLRRAPAFTLAAVVTLALGIGVTSAVFSVGNGLLWRPLPYLAADRLALIHARGGQAAALDQWSWGDYEDFRQGTRSTFEDLVAYAPVPLSLRHGDRTERIWGELVSGNYFATLGSPMTTGRGFQPGEDRPGAPPVAVLSYATWQARFDGDPGVVGRAVRLGGHEFTVVGVANRGFRSPFYPGFAPAVWVSMAAAPLLSDEGGRAPTDRGALTVRLLGRLRPGVTPAQAGAEADGVAARLAQAYPSVHGGRQAVVLRELDARPEPGLAAGFRLGMQLLLAVAALVLGIACANVAALLLSRAVARQREVVVRMALGAGRLRLIRHLLAEGLVLALAGGALGLGLGGWLATGLAALLDLPTDIPFAFAFPVDGRVVAFTSALTLGTVLLFALLPAVQASGVAIAAGLRHESVGWRGARRSRLRRMLVVGQLAVSCMLVASAALIGRSLEAMRRADLGFATDHRLLVAFAPGLAGYDSTQGRALYHRVLERAQALPGVRAVSLAEGLPLEFTSYTAPLDGEGRPTAAVPGPAPEVGFTVVSDRYFETLATPVEEGRGFQPGDTAGAPVVAVVSRAMAAHWWPGRSALGRVVTLGGEDSVQATIVGVASDAKYRAVAEAPADHLYLPLAQVYAPQATLVLHVRGDPLAAAGPVRAMLSELDPNLPVADLKTMDALVAGRALLFARLGSALASSLGLLALLLALVGLYGVIAYAVAQRTRELGIRLALGASRGAVLRLVLADGMRLLARGVGAGLVLALAGGRLLAGFLYQVAPFDPLSLAWTVAVLGVTTLAATAVPAWQAARTAPGVALRAD